MNENTKVWAATRLLFSRREVASLLNLSVRSIDHLILTGRLQSRKLGHRRMVPRDSLENFAGVTIREPMRMRGLL